MDETQFKRSGKNTEIPQQLYNALTEIKTRTYKQYKQCINRMAQTAYNHINTDKPQEKTTIEKIKEQQQKLNSYTHNTKHQRNNRSPEHKIQKPNTRKHRSSSSPNTKNRRKKKP